MTDVTYTGAVIGAYSDTTDFLPYVTPYVPGAESGIQLRVIREALREFCRDTEVWTDTLTTTTVEGEDTYPLDTLIDEDAEVLRVTAVSDNECLLREYSYTIDREHNLVLSSASSVTGNTIEVGAVLVPTRLWDSVDMRLLGQFADGIGAGAVYRLMMMEGMPWYRPNSAQEFLRRYRSAKSDARIDHMSARKATIGMRPI